MSDALVEKPEVAARNRIALWTLSPGPSAVSRAVSMLRALLPLKREDFEQRLVLALQEATASGSGFFLGGFAARRALGSKLVIDIDPLRLKRRLSQRTTADGKRVYLQDRFVGVGNWKPLLLHLVVSATHRDVEEIVKSGFDYRSTEGYRLAMERSRGPSPVRRNFVALKSPRLVESYFRHTTRLCRSISEHGMGRREDYRSTASAFRHPRVRLPWVEFMEADIGVAIGGKGEIYHFATGKHRIAAAQALRLEKVPVEVRVVHAAWLQRQIRKTKLSPVDALLAGIRSLDIGQPGVLK